MGAKNSPVERLGNVIATSIKRLDLGTRLEEYGVWPIWNEIVGDVVARNAQPEKIRNGTLFIKCSSPVWMHQLQFMKEMIDEKLNDRLRRDIVKTLFFVVENIETEPVSDPKRTVPRKETAGTELEPDASFLESIEDPEIRAAFADLLKSYTRRVQKG